MVFRKKTYRFIRINEYEKLLLEALGVLLADRWAQELQQHHRDSRIMVCIDH